MTLNDIVREKTSDIKNALTNYENTIRHYGKQKKSLIKQREKLQDEIGNIQSDCDKKKKLLISIETEIDNLESKIEELRKNHSTVRDEINNIENHLIKTNKDVRQSIKQISSIGHEIQEKVAEKKRLDNTLRSKLLESFQEYIRISERKIVSLIETQKDKKVQLTARKKLEIARHDDPRVMELWEGRQELTKFLKSSSVGVIRKQLEKNLHKIEEDIDMDFPGALSVEISDTNQLEIEEIFVSENMSELFLPISSKTWDLMDSNISEDISLEAYSALKVIWEFAKGFDLNIDNARFKKDKDLISLQIDKKIEFTSESFSMTLPVSGEISFVLQKLPQEIEEVIKR